jgi:hypothetical protein
MKQPWEMTKEEYVGDKTGDAKQVAISAHPMHIKKAIANGEDVPIKVVEPYAKHNHWAAKYLSEKTGEKHEVEASKTWPKTDIFGEMHGR